MFHSCIILSIVLALSLFCVSCSESKAKSNADEALSSALVGSWENEAILAGKKVLTRTTIHPNGTFITECIVVLPANNLTAGKSATGKFDGSWAVQNGKIVGKTRLVSSTEPSQKVGLVEPYDVELLSVTEDTYVQRIDSDLLVFRRVSK